MAQTTVDTKIKHPAEIRPFEVHWYNQLAGGNIASSVFTVTGPDGSLTVNSSSHTNTISKVFLEGGTAGNIYKIENKITRTADIAELVFEFNVEVIDN